MSSAKDKALEVLYLAFERCLKRKPNKRECKSLIGFLDGIDWSEHMEIFECAHRQDMEILIQIMPDGRVVPTIVPKEPPDNGQVSFAA